MSTGIKSLTILNFIIIILVILSPAVLAEAPQIVEGTIVDIYNDAAAGEAFVTLKTKQGSFIIDCKNKSFATPIAPGDCLKVSVKNVRTRNNKTVGDLFSVIQHTPSQ